MPHNVLAHTAQYRLLEGTQPATRHHHAVGSLLLRHRADRLTRVLTRLASNLVAQLKKKRNLLNEIEVW